MQRNPIPAEPDWMSTAPTTNLSSDKNLEAMKNFSETYAKRTGTYFCVDPSVTAVVIEGLAKHKDDLGAPLCPCRHYEDKEAEVKAAFWNCPCIPMRERKECHCMLFLTPDNEFAGEQQDIAMEEIQAVRSSMA
jgi:ferredoxin-thioredoxin reductase catalytic chain